MTPAEAYPEARRSIRIPQCIPYFNHTDGKFQDQQENTRGNCKRRTSEITETNPTVNSYYIASLTWFLPEDSLRRVT